MNAELRAEGIKVIKRHRKSLLTSLTSKGRRYKSDMADDARRYSIAMAEKLGLIAEYPHKTVMRENVATFYNAKGLQIGAYTIPTRVLEFQPDVVEMIEEPSIFE